MPPRTRISNGKLAIGVLVGFAALGLGPVAHMMLNPSVDGNRELPSHMTMRGAYINSGSKDAGPDRPLTDIVRKQ
ncbi:hypothetical protein OEZ86_013815 [Tetradesmus obliquus]|uniref:Uncharacterized protein n=2 Tax=Tetradesmus obliquus TaxID=3088 RepID=A0ABY8UF98_TETOB|nr:hypothetical protein OEZ85_006019 [Tetradesmus obliquus]WIA40459.1 hypothetical protein OEZ86_013815 [Tetradesmus obliquus]|eukprot:jgi/Sobl393_1/10566/SZX69122.1